MSLNNITLSTSTLSNLYGQSLVAVQAGAEAPEMAEEKANIKALGKNQKQIVFVLNNATVAFATDEEMVLLTNLLGACKLSLDDIVIMNYSHNQGINDAGIRDTFHNKVLIAFGVTCQQFQLPFNVPEFQKYDFGDCTYLFNPPLHEFLNNAQLKRRLWQCLKVIFEIP